MGNLHVQEAVDGVSRFSGSVAFFARNSQGEKIEILWTRINCFLA